jgi:predicted amidohydrolase
MSPRSHPPPLDCRVALAQLEPHLGNLPKNLALHEAEIERARRAGAQLVLFPELSLTGYFLKDQTAEVALPLEAPELARLAELSRALTIGVGFVERARDGRCYNSVAYFEDGALLGVHRKVHLVTYGMFEEARDLAAGETFRPIESKLGRLGPLVCEDAWHLGGAWLYFLDDVDALVVHSSGPGRGVTDPGGGLASQHVWNTLLDSLALWSRTWVLFVNRVGVEDGVTFAGGSRVVDPEGAEAAALPLLEPGQLVQRLDAGLLRRARLATPLRRDERPWIVARELARRAVPFPAQDPPRLEGQRQAARGEGRGA